MTISERASGPDAGRAIPRVEDRRLLTGSATFGDDVVLPSPPLHLVFVRSHNAAGRIVSIDATEALASPGVAAVFTGDDLDIGPLSSGLPMFDAAMTRPLLAQSVVRFAGEPVAAVLAETRAQAVDAAGLVIVDIEPSPAVVDPAAALEPGAPRLFDAAASNVVFAVAPKPVDFDCCDVVVEIHNVNQRLSPTPIEPRSLSAYWEGERLVQFASSQGAHVVQAALLALYAPAPVRVINADVGGAFGLRGRPSAEEMLLGWLARRTGRPVRWVETRSESAASMGHGRAQHQRIRLGGTVDGHLRAYQLEIVQDAGAYPSIGAILPMATAIMGAGCYDIDEINISFTSVATNTAPVIAYRGAGRPEATNAIELAVNAFARRIGMDPAELRRRNFIRDDAFPYSNKAGASYDVGRYGAALDAALGAAGYSSLRAQQQARNEAGATRRLGIGVASYVEITGGPTGGTEFGRVTVAPDGSVEVLTGSTPTGQGHETSWTMLAADRLGIPTDRIRVRWGDTDLIPSGGVTGGSRSLQIAGTNVADAADRVVKACAQIAASLLEASADDIVSGPSGVAVRGSPSATVTWEEISRIDPTALSAVGQFTQTGATFPFGTHVAVVEIDTETGAVELLEVVACDDAGVILHRQLADGQLHGGLAQGIAQALFEGVVYDDAGTLLTSTMLDYLVPSAADMPSFRLVALETPTPRNPLGAKGIGESGTIGATAAVHNAVIDALAVFGVEHLQMPLTPESIWRSIHAR